MVKGRLLKMDIYLKDRCTLALAVWTLHQGGRVVGLLNWIQAEREKLRILLDALGLDINIATAREANQ